MKVDKHSMQLYLVTDRSWLAGRSLTAQVEAALIGGATFVQLREKNQDTATITTSAKEIAIICRTFGVPFVVNDDIDAAIAADADGVHIGQSDIDAATARKLLGNNKILGVSAETAAAALTAQQAGADYIGVGAVFVTDTKQDAATVSFATLAEICRAVTIPVVAIGGIQQDNILQLKGSGVDGVAVISALFAAPDIAAAAQTLSRLSKEMLDPPA